METIRDYLDTMFLNLPNTSEVQKARSELWQMMEDKYTELKNEGKSENEAVGTVISEFGNLEELSEDLGIQSFVSPTSNTGFKILTLDEAKQYLKDRSHQAYFIALGVFCCIFSVAGPILADGIQTKDSYGISFMMILIAIAVGLFVYPAIKMRSWNYTQNESCTMDFSTINYVRNEQDRYRTTHALLLTIGIALCILSIVPASATDYFNIKLWRLTTETIGEVLMFFLIAAGVFMIVLGNIISASFTRLLRLNKCDGVEDNFVPDQRPEAQYISENAATVMSVYWSTVICLYLCWSFLTFDWHITWILWPIAAVVRVALNNILKK
jgi:hypothetical protein